MTDTRDHGQVGFIQWTFWMRPFSSNQQAWTFFAKTWDGVWSLGLIYTPGSRFDSSCFGAVIELDTGSLFLEQCPSTTSL